MCIRFLCALFAVGLTVSAQAIAGTGYVPAAAVPVAPGQVMTFYASGVGSTVTDTVRAPAGDLPHTLAGVSVSLRQGASSLPVPMLEVRPIANCPTLGSAPSDLPVPPGVAGINICGPILGVTVQIPYELNVCPGCERPLSVSEAVLVINDGKAEAAIELDPLGDQVHILTACDLILNPTQPLPPVSTGLPCSPVVTHGDGSLVTGGNPAQVGETVTAWAVGLGATNPGAVTGRPPAQALPVAANLSIDNNYRVNALATKPFSVTLPPLRPVYAGLAPGYVGLYLVNFTIPAEPLQGTPRCLTALPPAGVNYPRSNFTLTVAGQSSFDAAAICVATHIPVD